MWHQGRLSITDVEALLTCQSWLLVPTWQIRCCSSNYQRWMFAWKKERKLSIKLLQTFITCRNDNYRKMNSDRTWQPCSSRRFILCQMPVWSGNQHRLISILENRPGTTWFLFYSECTQQTTNTGWHTTKIMKRKRTDLLNSKRYISGCVKFMLC